MGDQEGRNKVESGEAQNPSEAEERERRLAALRTLAEQATPGLDRELGSAHGSELPGSSAAPSPLRSAARPRRRMVVLSAVLIAVLVIIGVGIYQLTRPKSAPAPTIPAVLTLDLAKDHLGCPSSLAWSPDGTRLALMASTGRCNAPSDQDVTVLAIYDPTTGKLLRQFATSDLLHSYGLKGRTANVHWSPNGAMVAVDAVIYPKTIDGEPSLGLLLIQMAPGAHGETRLIQGPTYDPNTALSLPQPIWDVTGEKTATATPSLPLALTYRWTADGQIVADQAMPAGPAGGSISASPASITRWHSGTLESIPAVDSDGNLAPHLPPVAWYLTSYFPAWSPDGRYFTGLLLTTRLIAGGTPAAPITSGICANPQFTYFAPICAQPGVAPPDAALAAALASAQAGHELVDSQGTSYGTVWTSVSVDWRPDGKVLAAILPADGFLDQNSTVHAVRVTLLGAATGQPLATLGAQRPDASGSSSTPGVSYTAWSPNGKQLALVDYFSGRVTVWGGASLSALPR